MFDVLARHSTFVGTGAAETLLVQARALPLPLAARRGAATTRRRARATASPTPAVEAGGVALFRKSRHQRRTAALLAETRAGG